MKRTLGLVLLVLVLGLVDASLVSFTFITSSNDTIEYGIYSTDSVIFEIKTGTNQLCRYSSSLEDYLSMDSFEDNFNTVHRIEFSEMVDGIHTYYVRCRDANDYNDPTDGINYLTAIFKTSAPIAAEITLAESPLTSGKYEIELVTTKIPSGTPQLTYSYDGVSYNPIVLSGAGKDWSGYLVISDSPEEKVGSFKFEAKDLEGKTGTEIYGTKVFLTDTRPPEAINFITATGEYGEITLDWYLDDDEDIDKINIYRSKNPNVGLTDIYKTISGDSDYYVDSDVDNGETFYYRIAPEDDAKNLAGLSREVKATALISSSSSASSNQVNGLSPELWGKVDALLVQINFLEEDISTSESKINSVGDEEQRRLIEISSSLESTKSELSALKRAVESLKSQDISSEILDSRISSNQIKLNILKSKVPDSISIKSELESNQELDEESLRLAIIDYSPELSDSLVEKSIKASKSLIEESKANIRSKLTIFEIIYLDGSIKEISLFEHFISATLESREDSKFILKIPQGSLNSENIKMKNGEYTPEKENLFSFNTDTKKISYTTDEKISAQTLESVLLVPATITTESTKFTGFFLSNVSSSGSLWMSLLVVSLLGLTGYLFYIKKFRPTESVILFLEKARKVKSFQKEGKTEEANSLYENLKRDYSSLSEEEKSKVFKEVKKLHKK